MFDATQSQTQSASIYARKLAALRIGCMRLWSGGARQPAAQGSARRTAGFVASKF